MWIFFVSNDAPKQTVFLWVFSLVCLYLLFLNQLGLPYRPLNVVNIKENLSTSAKRALSIAHLMRKI